MALPSEIHPFLLTGNDGNQFKVANSLRFRASASAYLNRTNSTSSNRSTWTWSGWVKRGSLSYSTATLFGGFTSNFADRSRLYFENDDTLNFLDYIGAAITSRRTTNAKFRDPSAWYHVVCVYDTTNATAASRIRLYVNNTLQSYSTTTDPSQNYASGKINDNVEHAMARLNTEYFDGYMAEVNFVDGQALTPDSFGQTDNLTNQWIPKKYTGTYGSFGFYLPFNDKASVTDLTATATLTAPFGGTANNARVADGANVLSNTSTGSSFTFVQQDFGSQTQITRFSISSLYFTGGSSTFQVQFGDDATWNSYTVAASLSVTGTPKNYTGSINGYARYVRLIPTAFGTNGQAGVDAFIVYQDDFYLPNSVTPAATYSATFNGSSQYLLTATNAGLALGTSDFTIEYWMNTTTAQNGATLCCAGAGTVSYDGLFGYTTSGSLVTYLSSTGGSWDIASNRTIISTITTGRWYHIAFTRSGSTWRVFVDGTQVDTFTSSASLYQSGNQFTLGRAQTSGYFNGKLSNVRIIKGTALYTSNFSPSTSPLTAVTNTQLLTLQNATIIDNSTNALSITNSGTVTTSGSVIPWSNFVIGRDYSTNGFGWMSTNINATTPGTTYDVMKDVPVNWDDSLTGRGNYCVMPIFDNGTQTWTSSESNLRLYQGNFGSYSYTVKGTIAVNTGKWYFETYINAVGTGNDGGIGIIDTSWQTGVTSFAPNPTVWYYRNNGTIYQGTSGSGTNTSLQATGITATANDIIGVAFDVDAKTISFYKNGVLLGTSQAFTLTTGNYVAPAHRGYYYSDWSFNFGQRPFAYTPPSGYKALNTFNLSNPSLPLV